MKREPCHFNFPRHSRVSVNSSSRGKLPACLNRLQMGFPFRYSFSFAAQRQALLDIALAHARTSGAGRFSVRCNGDLLLRESTVNAGVPYLRTPPL